MFREYIYIYMSLPLLPIGLTYSRIHPGHREHTLDSPVRSYEVVPIASAPAPAPAPAPTPVD